MSCLEGDCWTAGSVRDLLNLRGRFETPASPVATVEPAEGVEPATVVRRGLVGRGGFGIATLLATVPYAARCVSTRRFRLSPRRNARAENLDLSVFSSGAPAEGAEEVLEVKAEGSKAVTTGARCLTASAVADERRSRYSRAACARMN